MKRLEIDGRIVTVYPKRIEVNGEEIITQGKILIELLPEVWTLTEDEHAASDSSKAGGVEQATRDEQYSLS